LVLTLVLVLINLRGKMFTFPEDYDSGFVRVDLDQKELRSFTVCMRVFTDLVRVHNLFQLTTNSSYNPDRNFVIYNDPNRDYDYNNYLVKYNGSSIYFYMKDYKINTWQSLCVSWAAVTGVVRVWIDGKHSSTKFISQSIMEGPMAIIIGKVQDTRSYSGSSFVGMISDLHLWDNEFIPPPMQNLGLSTHFIQGNVLSWSSLDYQIHGRVLLENHKTCVKNLDNF
uniref:Pentraxin family member n=1 Tax=Periophthalmus magnuspinnatus TaxID=409849 RepID=A0A3B4AGB0_9GOBI